MKKSEKIGTAIVAVLAIILASMLLTEYKNKPNQKDACDKQCLQGSPENWFLIGAPVGEGNNNFSTKDECVNSCMSRK